VTGRGKSRPVGRPPLKRTLAAAALATAVTGAAPAGADATFRSSEAQPLEAAGAGPDAAAATTLSLLSARRFVFLGERVRLRGRLTRNGRPLAGRAIRLKADPYPFGNGFRRIATAHTGLDGSFSFLGPPKRNTRYRVTAPALRGRSRALLVYADYSGRERHSWRSGRLSMGLTIFAPFGAPGPPGGEKIHFYLTQNGQSTMPRVASTHMRRISGSRMRGRAVARTRRPARGEHVWVCWREATSDGFGPPGPLDKTCGDDVVTTPPPP
jgi:hypothetical protein